MFRATVVNRRLPGGGLLCAVLLTLAAPAAAQSDAGSGHAWAPAVGPVFERYYAGNYAETQRAARALQQQSPDPAVQRDAAVLATLAQLRLPERAERVQGRAALAALVQESPSLGSEPECQLALGTALTSLRETSAALDALDQAVQGFAARGAVARQLAALVALAEAWAVHNEWEMTPARLQVPRPADREAAYDVRRTRMENLRDAAAGLPGGAAAADEIELALAELLLERGAADAGRGKLVALTSREPWHPAAVRAALRLGALLESEGDWTAALELYARVAARDTGEAARTAEERRQAITHAQIELMAPAVVPSVEPVRVSLQVRGVDAVEVEVRQVDLTAWLSSPRTRGTEASLPESGSLRHSATLSTRAPQAHGWWRASAADLPPFVLEPGAYALIVRGRSAADGAAVGRKQLVLVSDLRAACLVGSQDVILCATGPAPDAPVTAQFWMNRSFAARAAELVDGVLQLPLPNEAHLMREKGWVCLVRSGAHAAVLRGHVPVRSGGEAAPQVTLIAGPPVVSPGEQLSIAGVLLPTAGAAHEGLTAIDVQVCDAVERVQARLTLPVDAAGCFSGIVPVTPEMTGKSLRMLAYRDGQPLPNAAGRVRVDVSDPADERYTIGLRGGPTPAGCGGSVYVAYPWGAPAANKRVRLSYEVVQLPRPGQKGTELPGLSMMEEYVTRPGGKIDFELTREQLGSLAPPLAVRVTAEARSRDRRAGREEATWLLGGTGPQVWLWADPMTPTVGLPVVIRAGWFAPGGLVLAGDPQLAILGQNSLEPVAMTPDVVGATSAPWYPGAAGEYTVELELPVLGAAPLRRSAPLTVLPTPADSPIPARCAARRTGETVLVTIKDAPAAPLLVAVQDREPRAARLLPGQSGTRELSLTVSESASALRVLVAALEPAGLRVLCGAPVAPDPASDLHVDVDGPADAIWPGTTIPVRLRSNGLPSDQLGVVAQLTAGDAVGLNPRADPLLTGAAELPEARRSPVIVTSSGGIADAPAELRPVPEREALQAGGTLWTMARGAAADEEFAVDVPGKPGVYALDVLVRSSRGALAVRRVLLDARRGVQGTLEIAPRMLQGDRALAALRLENGYPTPLTARVQLGADAALGLDAPRVVAGELVGRAGGELILRLPPQGTTWVHVEIAALEAGPATLSAAIEAEGRKTQASAACDITPVPNAVGPLVVTREISVWEPKPESGERELEHPVHAHGPKWGWSPVTADTGLWPGQWLRVREEVNLPEAADGLSWQQHAPAVCLPIREDLLQVRPIGQRDTARDDLLVYAVGDRPAGRMVHEYLLLVVRPGSCTFPAPELHHSAGRLTPRVAAPWPLNVLTP